MKTVLIISKDEQSRNDLLSLVRHHRKNSYHVLNVRSVDDAVYLYDSGDVNAMLFLADLEKSVRIMEEENDSGGIIREIPLYGKDDFESGSEAAKFVQVMINRFFYRAYTARQYAAQVNISLTYLCRLFKKQTGWTIGNYIWKVRMEKAASYLSRTQIDIRDVASRVGYQHFPYFCKRFHDFYQMSPGAYRRRHQRND